MTRRSQEIAKMQEAELRKGIFNATQSFHSDFLDCPWIIVRNLSFMYSEGDIATIFEQYGTIIAMELIRDEKTGDSKGTAIISYEDPRSAVLAVDNFNGVSLLGRTINVDHVNYEISKRSKLVDPRTMVPARLRKDQESSKPVFDDGSASSTEYEED